MATPRLQLHINAKELKNLGGIFSGTSDPFAVVTVRGDNVNNKPHVVGQTDVVFNNLNPSWSRVVYLEGYKFGVPFYFEVGIFDFDASKTGKSELELSRMDCHSQAVITSNAASRHLMRDGKFPHKVMGTALFEVGQILAAKGNVGSKSLQSGGAVYVHIERSVNAKNRKSPGDDVGRLRLQLRGLKLTNCQTLGRTSSPFYELYRKVERPTGATWISVYRSNVARADLNPLWTEVSLDMEATCNDDVDRAMKVILRDHRRSGKHKIMGEFETTIRGLIEASADRETSDFGYTVTKDEATVGIIQVVNATLSHPHVLTKSTSPSTAATTAASTVNGGDSGQQQNANAAAQAIPKSSISSTGSGHAASGSTDFSTSRRASENKGIAPGQHQQEQLSASSNALNNKPEFVDYLSGGCQISLAVAIDFTASNGDPRQPGTPHYFHPPESQEWNDYEKAIFAVGSILAKYDSDQQFPVWGFGAKYNQVVRHCFQCGSEIEVEGVQGIMDAYRGVFRTPLTMSYPTKFTEVIQTAASYARHEQEVAEEDSKQSYTILLILTAGNVENVIETKKQLIEASDDPLSVVIVGIGDADFKGMEFLDEHDPMREGGRDITKFVRFSDYKSFNALTEAVLDEIPQQLVSYFYDRNIMPGQLEDFNENDVKIEEADDDERTYTFLG